jgi:Protein of unknown function (DUF2914)
MSSIGVANDTITAWVAPILRYERHLSAIAMVAGFGIDNYSFGRIDRPRAHLIFGSYLTLAAITIAASHWLQTRTDAKRVPATTSADEVAAVEALTDEDKKEEAPAEPSERWRKYLPAATQFALGGLWSGFLVFYSRSASLTASWLFLATLAAFLVGNEIFRKYHSRLVFASLLLFFATYSYAVFTVPVVTRTIGKITFLASGAVAIVAFLVFLRVLQMLGRARFAQARWPLLGGAAAIAVAMNLFYFTGVLPPLPLALTRIGIFHSVKHTGAIYQAQGEPQPWYTNYGIGDATMHVADGEPISLYSAVFAPVALSTRITHRWLWYDPGRERWTTQSIVTFPINGGRDGGYRGYTIKSHPKPGDWRVDIDSADGRLIGRLRFVVEQAAAAVQTTNVTLN